ncbi:MAG: hypothetical protein DRO39_01990 [Thermoprotei archaeon]|nr:MAG: hypothetical protein DRO39_01990 [Thermoprotei archaeon]
MIGLVLRQREFLLIVLDAMRYDVFERIYRDYLDGTLYKVWSSGSCTIEWLRNTFTGFYDLVYVSACGFCLAGFEAKTRHGSFSADRHFKRTVNVFADDWDDELGTVHPSSVNKRALENAYPRMIVHYLQPHAPLIGEPRLLMNEKQITDAVRRGRLSRTYVERAYEGNARLVLQYVRELVERMPHRNVYVTSDHGELLGENGVYDHPCGSYDERLRIVPFLVVRSESIG